MSTPTFTPRGGHPYPPVAFDNSREAVARLAEATRDWPRPDTEVHYPSVAALMDAQAELAVAPPLDIRVPGATRPRPAESFAAFPVPVPVQVPEPVQPPAPPAPPVAAGWPEGVVRGLLIGALWNAVHEYDGIDLDWCPVCDAENGLCGFHGPRMARVPVYEELHDFVTVSRSDSAALHGVAVAVRTGDADLGDIARLGSPLEALLLAQLERLGADGGSR